MSAAPNTLYISECNRDINERDLYCVFANARVEVTRIRLFRDPVTRKSLGRGYIYFSSQALAKRALESLNYTMIRRQPFRLSWARLDPSLRNSHKGNIFVKNLDLSQGPKEVHDVAVKHGAILSCKVVSTGTTKHAFVHFENEEDSEAAIKELNGKILNGRTLYAAKFLSREQLDKQRARSFTNIYVRSGKINDDELIRTKFENYGVVKNVAIMRDAEGNTKGFAFVSMEKHEDAEKACNELDGKPSPNGEPTLKATRAMKKAERRRELAAQKRELRLTAVGIF